MFSIALKSFNLVRHGCLYISTLMSTRNVTRDIAEKVELKGQAIRYDNNESAEDPRQDIENNNHQIMLDLAQLAILGDSSYRAMTGDENLISLAVSCCATALILYQPVKGAVQTVMENETVSATTKKIFQYA